jgi:hypothetical protein
VRTARTLIEVMHTTQTFTAIFENALSTQVAAAPTQLPPLFLERFKTAVNGALPELLEDLAQLYARTYSRAEMESYITFFRSPAGQSFTAKQAAIGTESATIGQRWGGALAMRVMSDMIQKGEMQAPQ